MSHILQYLRTRIASQKWIRVFILSTLVGIVAGAGAIAFNFGLKYFLHSINLFEIRESELWWLLPLIPAVGGLLAGILVFTFAPEAEGHGTDSVIEAYHWQQGVIRGRVPIIKTIASILTIGTGGSAGKEGPIAQIGAGFGSFLASILKLGAGERRQLVLAGVAGGIGAIFHAPLGGAIFATEVLYQGAEYESHAVVPCVLSSIVAYSMFSFFVPSGLLFTGDPAIPIAVVETKAPATPTPTNSETDVLAKPVKSAPVSTGNQPSNKSNVTGFRHIELILYLGLGLFCALIGRLYIASFYGFKNKIFHRLRMPQFIKPALGGLCVGILALLDPRILSVGTEAINAAISGNLSLPDVMTSSWGLSVAGATAVVAFILALGKILSTSLTVGSGGSGGVFGPSVFIGAMLGAAFGSGVMAIQEMGWLPEICSPAAQRGLVLVGMGGFFAGVGKVPLSTLILVSEITGSYHLLVPLMLTCFIAYVLSGGRTIYIQQVRAPADSPAHLGEYEKSMLDNLMCGDVIANSSASYRTIHEGTPLRKLWDILAGTRQTIFPVVDGDEKLTGVIDASGATHIPDREALADIVVCAEIAQSHEHLAVHASDSLYIALRRMTEQRIRELPVIDDHKGINGKVVGLLNYNDIVAGYHEAIQKLRAETHIAENGAIPEDHHLSQ